jgi:hypothetical protein
MTNIGERAQKFKLPVVAMVLSEQQMMPIPTLASNS